MIKKLIRLTFLAICLSFCLLILSCQKREISLTQEKILPLENAIDINSANISELENLPGIGKGLALRIKIHREKFGVFQKVEDLLLVKGISDSKFRKIQNLVKVNQ